MLGPRTCLDRPTRFGSLRRVAMAASLTLAGAAIAGDPTAPSTKTTPTAAQGNPVTTIVAGIVGYTRWPAETVSIRLCTLGQGRAVDDLLRAADLGSAQRAVAVRPASDAADAWKDCDAIYVGTLAGRAARDVLQRVMGHPVLMVGEGPEFCSDGGMFCIDPATAAVRFTVNLDAIARSGLRVNPSVLRIARGAPVSGP